MDTLIEIKIEEIDDIIIYELIGELDETNADNTFKEIMGNIEKGNHSKYILNLSQIKYMNSKSIGYISSMYEFITDNQKMMHLVSDNKELTEILDMVGMKGYIPFYTTNEESIKEMKS